MKGIDKNELVRSISFQGIDKNELVGGISLKGIDPGEILKAHRGSFFLLSFLDVPTHSFAAAFALLHSHFISYNQCQLATTEE